MDTAIVIGGGPAGLVAAATLADAGVATTLLEAKAGFGGRAASERQEGFDLNQGPHALYAGSCAMRELKRLGVSPPRWNPGTAVTRSVFVRDGKPFGPVRGWGSLGRLARADAPPEMSAREWIDTTLAPRHRGLAETFVRVTTFVADYDALPADVARAQLRLGVWPGVRYLVGGWQWMIDALVTQAEHRGATLHRRSAVRSLERSGDRWTVATDEREHTADAVVVAAGLPSAFAKLVDGLEVPGPPAEVSVLDLGFKETPNRTTLAFGVDEPTYYSKHSPPKKQDGVLMTAMSYTGGSVADLERIPDTVHPGWRDHLVLHRHLPRMTPVGAVASFTRRPPVEHAPGLFVAGDWIGDEGWLTDAAMASGVAAARAALGERVAVPA